MDMTKVWTASHGWVYLHAIIDCCTREIPAWTLDLRGRTQEAIACVESAVLARELAADLDRICVRRDQLTADIEGAFLSHPLEEVLASLCGFGPRTGARTLAEIGDPHRFADGSRLAAYAGLAPVDWQSGRSATARKPRGGNHRLKNAMFTAAFVATQHLPDARAYYQRKRAEGKRHNAAVVCVARRRCNIIPATLKTQTPLPTTPSRNRAPSRLERLDNKTGTPPL